MTHTHIDQLKTRRLVRTGITAYDKELACPGYVLFSPLYGHTTYLMALDGTFVHQWEHEHVPGLSGYVTPQGTLFYSAKVRDSTWDIFPIWSLFKGGLLQEYDWDGNIVWEHVHEYIHHDARKMDHGGAMYLSMEQVPPEIEKRVQGGVKLDDLPMWTDVIIEVDKNGNKIWEWRALDHMDVALDHIAPNVPRWEWTHGNAVVPLDDNRVLISMRNTSTLAIIDKKSGKFLWKIGDELLGGQHDPSMLANGNILVYDNGIYRTHDWLTHSKVLEINPKTNEVEWEYADAPWWDFYSPTVSGAQRLPNGNTLITEGTAGRMFQVTHEGQVVWEYVNPFFNINPRDWEVNMVFRGRHYMEDELPQL